MTTRESRMFSDLPIPPGEILAEEIEARGMTQKELAARLNRPAQAINEIIKAKKAITADTAIGLEKALGIEAHFWTHLEADYSMTLARNRDRDRLAANVVWLKDYPITEMIKRGWIKAGRDKPSRLDCPAEVPGSGRCRTESVSGECWIPHYGGSTKKGLSGSFGRLAPHGRTRGAEGIRGRIQREGL